MDTKRSKWVEIVSELNKSDNIKDISEKVLKDLCEFFDFGVGFIYEVDYRGDFILTSKYFRFDYSIPEKLQLNEMIHKDIEREFSTVGYLYNREDLRNQTYSEKVYSIFNAKSIIAVPIKGSDKDGKDAIVGTVGLIDRRGDTRLNEKDDLEFTIAVLNTLSAHVKMNIYRKRAESTMASLERILDHMGIDVYVNDFESHEMLYMNKSMAEPYGEAKDLIGKVCWNVLYNDKTCECDFCPKPKLIDDEGKPSKVYGWDYQRPFDGSWFRVLSAAFPWTDGRLAQVISSVDITENKRNEEIIRRSAEYDLLTSIPNRTRLSNDLEKVLDECYTNNTKCDVVFIDLDGFKLINDKMGHDIGDELLTKIGEFFQENPMTKERSYRYGGDEFVLIHKETDPFTLDEQIKTVWDKLLAMWPLSVGDVQGGASIGVACYPEDGETSTALLRNADYAMYSSKAKGTGFVHYYNAGDVKLEDMFVGVEMINNR